MSTDTPAMSEERLAEIDRTGYADDHEVIGELLAEVKRLRQEDPVVTAMREYGAELKRKAARFTVCVAVSAAAWILLTNLMPEPWAFLVALPMWGGSGLLIGACEVWIENRREARRDT